MRVGDLLLVEHGGEPVDGGLPRRAAGAELGDEHDRRPVTPG
jgi:hypothetical protein